MTCILNHSHFIYFINTIQWPGGFNSFLFIFLVLFYISCNQSTLQCYFQFLGKFVLSFWYFSKKLFVGQSPHILYGFCHFLNKIFNTLFLLKLQLAVRLTGFEVAWLDFLWCVSEDCREHNQPLVCSYMFWCLFKSNFCFLK